MIIQESSLFLELTPAQLKKIINSSLNENIISYRLMEGGMFNTAYLIQPDNMQKTRSFIYETTEKLLKGEF